MLVSCFFAGAAVAAPTAIAVAATTATTSKSVSALFMI
jgi:hypothetical protein